MSKNIERAIARAKKEGAIGGWQVKESCKRLSQLKEKLDTAIKQMEVVEKYPADGIYLEDEVSVLIDALLGISGITDDVMVLLFGRGANVVENYALNNTARDDNYLRSLSNAMAASNPDLAEQVGISRPKNRST